MLDEDAMRRAIEVAREARVVAHPNPWVGCVLLTPSGRVITGSTQAPGGNHAEIEALEAAGPDARGATVVVTLEPCCIQGRTPACTDALVDAGVRRVVVGLTDPDERVSGRGIERLRSAGIEVTEGVLTAEVEVQLAPYVHHRRTGRPYVIAKLAASADGRTAAPDGSSRWITGNEARTDAHRLRAESDAVIVGAGTVRADDPALTVRHVEGPDPERVVLGSAPPDAAVHPCRELTDEPLAVLEALGRDGMVQVMIEGGPSVVGEFHRAGLIDRYVLYLAPVLFGGDDALGLFRGPGAPTIDEVWRGRIDRVDRLGDDLRVDLVTEDVAQN